jgi:AcrR family transcriptional regulator
MTRSLKENLEPDPPQARRPSLRDEQKGLTRARLLESAIEVFAHHGFADATIGEIAEAANASRATFYLHFKSKEDIVAAIVAETAPDVADYYSRLDDVLASGSRGAFRAWMIDALHWFEEHQTIVVALEHILLSNRGLGASIMQPFAEHMPKFLHSWPAPRRLEGELRVWLLVMLMSRVNIAWKVSGSMSQVHEDLMVDVLTDLWTEGLKIKRSTERSHRARKAPS